MILILIIYMLKKHLKDLDLDIREYISNVKKQVKKAGYNPKYLTLSDDPKKKFTYNNIDFGSSINNDYIIYKMLDKKNNTDIADKKRNAYRARAKSIYEKSKLTNQISPSILSFDILW